MVDRRMESRGQIDPMITHTLPLEEIKEGFDLMRARDGASEASSTESRAQARQPKPRPARRRGLSLAG